MHTRAMTNSTEFLSVTVKFGAIRGENSAQTKTSLHRAPRLPWFPQRWAFGAIPIGLCLLPNSPPICEQKYETVLPNQESDQYGSKLQVNLSRIGRAFDNARRRAFLCDAEFAVELLVKKKSHEDGRK